MTNKKEIYKCEVCGNIIEVIDNSNGILTCCNQPMTLLDVKQEENGNEKHKPVYEIFDNSIRITVGEINHPMEPEHYIQWIELITKNLTLRKELTPDDNPEAIFDLNIYEIDDGFTIRSYCNKHGLWETKKE